MSKKLPSENQMYDALKNANTDSISRSWLQRKFSVGFKDSEKLFDQLVDYGYINSNGKIKIEQSPKDEEF